MTENDERTFSMLIYLANLLVPVIGPLTIWLLKKEASDFVDFHGRQYINFLISYTFYGTGTSLLIIFGIVRSDIVVLIMAILLTLFVSILALVFTLVAMVKAFSGERFRISLTIPILQ